MATNVHVHYYSGLAQIPKNINTQFSGDSVYSLTEPALGGGVDNITTAETTLPAAPDRTALARVQVADGGKVRYTVINNATGIVADQSSPAMVGESIIHFAPGWQLSLIEAT